MIKPPIHDMESGNVLNWTELFTMHMMSIDDQCEGILKNLQRDAFDYLRDTLKMTHAVNKSANHAWKIKVE